MNYDASILVLHHNDRDGYMAAACIEYFYAFDYFEDEEINRIYYPVNYTEYIEDMIIDDYSSMEDAFKNADTIYLVDYSIQNEKNTNFILKYADKVIWLDHHITSIETETKYPELKKIKGLRIVGMSGALLSWIWINNYAHRLDTNIQNIYNQREVKDFLRPLGYQAVPNIILYTHRYDIWDISNNVRYFNFGYSTLDIDTMAMDIYLEVSNKRSVSTEAINDGRTIMKYVIAENEDHIKSNGVPFTLKIDSEEYSVILCNITKPSSLKFGKYANEYDILMPFVYTNKGVSYSLYKGPRCKNPDLDLSSVAKKLGGGGHAGAAGFFIPDGIPRIKPEKDSVVSLEDIIISLNYHH